MAQQHRLTLTCSLIGPGDRRKVVSILEQYGLHAECTAGEVTAEGSGHVVLSHMKTCEIESHLAARIEDAVPGTRVVLLKAVRLAV